MSDVLDIPLGMIEPLEVRWIGLIIIFTLVLFYELFTLNSE